MTIPQITVTPSMRRATRSAIERIARATAEHGTGQRKIDAEEHLRNINRELDALHDFVPFDETDND